MSAVQIEVQMLGPMTLRCEGQEVRDTDNRARKIWLLLAYMAARRGQAIPQEELVALLWEREERSSNPANALKTMFHRLRSMMCQLDALRDRNLIIRKNGTYSWNPDLCFTLDTETFESLCRDALACQDPGQQLELLRRALALYRGDFLPKLSSESWVNAVNTYYHGLYLQSVSRLVALLEARGEPPVKDGARLTDLLRRPRLSYADLAPFDPERPPLPPAAVREAEITVKYSGYIDRQLRQVEEMKRLEERPLPPGLDYLSIQGLRLEAQQKLDQIRPQNLGQASRVSGVSPADVAVLMVYLKQEYGGQEGP